MIQVNSPKGFKRHFYLVFFIFFPTDTTCQYNLYRYYVVYMLLFHCYCYLLSCIHHVHCTHKFLGTFCTLVMWNKLKLNWKKKNWNSIHIYIYMYTYIHTYLHVASWAQINSRVYKFTLQALDATFILYIFKFAGINNHGDHVTAKTAKINTQRNILLLRCIPQSGRKSTAMYIHLEDLQSCSTCSKHSSFFSITVTSEI